ncbi:cAMP-binding domain of CRP or a regulatory subunit of cAMP-dependent protein kinases [Algoriphagus faecimaris]|uniref:cAMP-binding domain of CRP or a regulatory subunit of cAMP-dependent protein kinases n=1 Tax=Algoriphagus faecimaris TaxID=686796 RepID=A0A1G6TZ54_9BACT|nr:cAMP-binding domain of CRP or a regulatory subunit of cAMP-dependent protein kinases [Algoriphagus faecimaris]
MILRENIEEGAANERKHLEAARKLLFDYLPLSDSQWEVFKQGFRIRKYKKGEFVLREGETERFLSIVIQGLTRHFVLVQGEEHSFDFSFQHEFNCSYSSFIQQKPSRFYIEALDDCILASLPYTFLQSLYEQFPESNKFGRTAVEQYYIWREQRELSLLTESASERYEKLMQKYPVYLEQVPLKYLASYLNIKPESLSRIRKGLLQK